MSPTDHDQDKLLGYAYGELSSPEAKSLEAHLKDCAQCSRALEDIRKVRRTMAQLPTVPAPAAGLDSLLAYAQQAARRAQAGSTAHSRVWKWVLLPSTSVLAMVLLIVVTTRVYFRRGDRLQQIEVLARQPSSPSPVAEPPAASDIAQAAKPAESPKEKEAASKAESKPSAQISMKAAPRALRAANPAPDERALRPSGKPPVADHWQDFARPLSIDESETQSDRSRVKAAAAPQESRGVAAVSAPEILRGPRDALDREIARTQDTLRTKTLARLERARLLNHLCELLYAANRSSEADSTCDQVIRDFPGSAAADAARQLKEKNQRDPAR